MLTQTFQWKLITLSFNCYKISCIHVFLLQTAGFFFWCYIRVVWNWNFGVFSKNGVFFGVLRIFLVLKKCFGVLKFWCIFWCTFSGYFFGVHQNFYTEKVHRKIHRNVVGAIFFTSAVYKRWHSTKKKTLVRTRER